jgi:D-glycero-beta-D-manno-heptose 1-phosphate adenylyltransferase
VVFAEATPGAALAQLKPEIHCKGADYDPGGKPVPETEVVEAYRGRVCFLPQVKGISTSEMIQRIRKL